MSVITDYGPLVRLLHIGTLLTVMVRDEIASTGWTEYWSADEKANEFAVVEADQKARRLRRDILEGEYAA